MKREPRQPLGIVSAGCFGYYGVLSQMSAHSLPAKLRRQLATLAIGGAAICAVGACSPPERMPPDEGLAAQLGMELGDLLGEYGKAASRCGVPAASVQLAFYLKARRADPAAALRSLRSSCPPITPTPEDWNYVHYGSHFHFEKSLTIQAQLERIDVLLAGMGVWRSSVLGAEARLPPWEVKLGTTLAMKESEGRAPLDVFALGKLGKYFRPDDTEGRGFGVGYSDLIDPKRTLVGRPWLFTDAKLGHIDRTRSAEVTNRPTGIHEAAANDDTLVVEISQRHRTHIEVVASNRTEFKSVVIESNFDTPCKSGDTVDVLGILALPETLIDHNGGTTTATVAALAIVPSGSLKEEPTGRGKHEHKDYSPTTATEVMRELLKK